MQTAEYIRYTGFTNSLGRYAVNRIAAITTPVIFTVQAQMEPTWLPLVQSITAKAIKQIVYKNCLFKTCFFI